MVGPLYTGKKKGGGTSPPSRSVAAICLPAVDEIRLCSVLSLLLLVGQDGPPHGLTPMRVAAGGLRWQASDVRFGHGSNFGGDASGPRALIIPNGPTGPQGPAGVSYLTREVRLCAGGMPPSVPRSCLRQPFGPGSPPGIAFFRWRPGLQPGAAGR